jgi:N-acetylmuramoyl-L-alanine amidase
LESPAEFTVSRLDNPSRMIIELRAVGAAPDSIFRAPEREASPLRRETAPVGREAEPMREPPRRASAPPPAISDPPSLKADVVRPQVARMAAKTMTTSVVVLPAPPSSTPPAAGPSKSEANDSAPVRSASRTAPPRVVPKAARGPVDGETSLIRALGLKINRVVIDPGHGGADEGTVGRRGLMEKELVLDVAKRVGKLIEDRMGSEVIYTRTDDTFIPLHARTEMANEKKADLFLSIHANSSPHPKIGGIEVYYLNFTRSSDALDVAARENASSEKSVFELKDLIQSITLHEKVEESREFASKVQGSLQTFETRYNAAAKNRGIKKAPFVVLIGASMPSVLAEVGFLSNAREEQLLKRADHRQRLAEALYQGVSRYAQSLSHFQVAQRTSVD